MPYWTPAACLRWQTGLEPKEGMQGRPRHRLYPDKTKSNTQLTVTVTPESVGPYRATERGEPHMRAHEPQGHHERWVLETHIQKLWRGGAGEAELVWVGDRYWRSSGSQRIKESAHKSSNRQQQPPGLMNPI